jgi:hypothetical protein
MRDCVQISIRIGRSKAFLIYLSLLCILNYHYCKEVVHFCIVDTTKLYTFEKDRRETDFFRIPSVDCLDLCTIEYVKNINSEFFITLFYK